MMATGRSTKSKLRTIWKVELSTVQDRPRWGKGRSERTDRTADDIPSAALRVGIRIRKGCSIEINRLAFCHTGIQSKLYGTVGFD